MITLQNRERPLALSMDSRSLSRYEGPWNESDDEDQFRVKGVETSMGYVAWLGEKATRESVKKPHDDFNGCRPWLKHFEMLALSFMQRPMCRWL